MDFIFIILSSLLFTIPLYQPELFFLSWFAFIPLIYLTSEYDYSHSFIIALLVGFLNSLFSFYWLYQPLNQALKMPFSFNIFILLLYFLYSALALAFWLLINKFLQPKYSYSPFIAALSWSVLEFIRFEYLNLNPFNYFAYSQSSFFLFSRYAAYGGIFLVSFIAVLVASYLVKISLYFSWKKTIPLLMIFLILIITPHFISGNSAQEAGETNLSLLNFNADSGANNFEKLDNEIRFLTALTAEVEAKYIFTPEKSISFDLRRNNYYRQKLYAAVDENTADKYLQLGSYAAGSSYDSEANNSLFLLNGDLKITERYNKERNFLNTVNLAVKDDIFAYLDRYLNLNYRQTAQNKGPVIFKADQLSYLNLIGEEIFIPAAASDYNNQETANLIVNSAREKDISAPIYNNFSLAAAVFRAAENGSSVLRVVNGGYSAYIDYQGSIIWQDRLQDESRTFLAELKHKNTYYQQNPDQIIVILASVLALISLIKIIIVVKNKLSSRN